MATVLLRAPFCWWFPAQIDASWQVVLFAPQVAVNLAVLLASELCLMYVWNEIQIRWCTAPFPVGGVKSLGVYAGSLSAAPQIHLRNGNAVWSPAALRILGGCDMSCLLKQFTSQSSFWLGMMFHKAPGRTQLKMLFHSSAGLRRKACADVSNSGRHNFPDIRKTRLPAWQNAPAGESLRSLLCILSMYCFSWKSKLDSFMNSAELWKSTGERLCFGWPGYRKNVFRHMVSMKRWLLGWEYLELAGVNEERQMERGGIGRSGLTRSFCLDRIQDVLAMKGAHQGVGVTWLASFIFYLQNPAFSFPGKYTLLAAEIHPPSQSKKGVLKLELPDERETWHLERERENTSCLLPEP